MSEITHRPVQVKRKTSDNYCLPDHSNNMASNNQEDARQAQKVRIVRQDSRATRNEQQQNTEVLRLGFRLPDNIIPFFKILRKLHQTKIKSQHHSTFLQKCLDERYTPKGLRSNVTSQIPDQDIEFTFRWEKAHQAFATELTTLLCSYYTERVENTIQKIEEKTEALKKECNEETLGKIQEYLGRLDKDLETTLTDRRAKKLLNINTGGSNDSNQQQEESTTS